LTLFVRILELICIWDILPYVPEKRKKEDLGFLKVMIIIQPPLPLLEKEGSLKCLILLSFIDCGAR